MVIRLNPQTMLVIDFFTTAFLARKSLFYCAIKSLPLNYSFAETI